MQSWRAARRRGNDHDRPGPGVSNIDPPLADDSWGTWGVHRRVGAGLLAAIPGRSGSADKLGKVRANGFSAEGVDGHMGLWQNPGVTTTLRTPPFAFTHSPAPGHFSFARGGHPGRGAFSLEVTLCSSPRDAAPSTSPQFRRPGGRPARERSPPRFFGRTPWSATCRVSRPRRAPGRSIWGSSNSAWPITSGRSWSRVSGPATIGPRPRFCPSRRFSQAGRRPSWLWRPRGRSRRT